MVLKLPTKDEFTEYPYSGLSLQLKDIEPLSFEKEEEDSFIACYRRYLASAGFSFPYWLLMAASGAAFRLQVHFNGWRLVSLDAACGCNLLPDLYAVCQQELEERWICADRERQEKAKARIVQELTEGRPVIGLGLDGYARYGLVTGIRPGGLLIAQDYTLSFYPHPVTESMVWCYFLGRPKKEASPTEEDLYRQGLKKALELAGTTRAKGYYVGQTAYDYWYATLTNPMHHDPLSDDWRARERNEGNYQLYKGLISARKMAARFFREMAVWKPETEIFALPAATAYDALVTELEPFIKEHVVRPASQIGEGRPWTIRERRKQARALRRAADIEMRTLPLLQALQAYFTK